MKAGSTAALALFLLVLLHFQPGMDPYLVPFLHSHVLVRILVMDVARRRIPSVFIAISGRAGRRSGRCRQGRPGGNQGGYEERHAQGCGWFFGRHGKAFQWFTAAERRPADGFADRTYDPYGNSTCWKVKTPGL